MATLPILIIEEPSLPRNVLIKALNLWGYQCALAENSPQALEWIKKLPRPSLLLVNWRTGFLDCEKFFKLARRNSTGSLHILAALPAHSANAIQRSILAGADDFVRWPYDLDEVRVRLHIAHLLLGTGVREPCFGPAAIAKPEIST